MSGTSLDGVDIALCEFHHVHQQWTFQILKAETIPYSEEWKNRLSGVEKGTAFDLALTDSDYGHLLGQLCKSFIDRQRIKPDFIASHGHTIFHQPGQHLTCQIGRGSAIAAVCEIPVICDFRSLDVALGGQGAPLVPIGDHYLFPEYDFCLNLGGFANISFENNDQRIAFDICPVNIVLNYLSGKIGSSYDKDGIHSRSGKINQELLSHLESLEYYHRPPPKSLGKEWVVEIIHPLLQSSGLPVRDQLATFSEHIALQIARVTRSEKSGKTGKILLTGGGTFNKFLIGKLEKYCVQRIVIPPDFIVNYKEALIFAFLGILRWQNETNCLKSVTGAMKDSSGGAIY